MPVNRLEALADAIMAFEGWHPGDRPYRNRNPGDMRFSRLESGQDPGGYAVFESFTAGYTALLNDLHCKCAGHTVTGLQPTSLLQDLINVWAPSSDHNDPHRYVNFVARFVSTALGLEVTPSTDLDWFLNYEGGEPTPSS